MWINQFREIFDFLERFIRFFIIRLTLHSKSIYNLLAQLML